MASFFAKKVLLPFDDSDRLVEASDFQRTVHFTFASNAVHFGFEEFTITSGAEGDWAQFIPLSNSDRFTFALPAGQELWAGHSADGLNVSVAFVVTA